MNPLINFAYNLCAIPSISGHEKDCLIYMCRELTKRGFFVEQIPVAADRFNILASFDKRPKYSALFCTHLDTVAPHVEPHIDTTKEVLEGRGSCDAKGIAACMIEAICAQREQGFHDLALLLTVGEEEASDGAKACQPLLLNRADYVVVGEPTELKAASAQKGSLVFDLEACGKEAHSSMPHMGISAIHLLLDGLKKLLDYPWPSHPVFEDTFLNVGVIEGGSRRNVLAKNAQAHCIMRTSHKADEMIAIIKKLKGNHVNLHVHSASDPFQYYTPPGFATFIAGFGSDAPYLAGVGKPILLGPGSLSVAHTPHEYMSFQDLMDGVSAYQAIASHVRGGFYA